MEEPLFENETLLDRRLFYTAIAAYYKVIKIVIRVIYLVLGVLFLGLAAGYIVSREYVIAVIAVIGAAACVFIFFMGHLLSARKSYRAVQAVNPDGHYSFTFYDDCLEETTRASNLALDYAKVTKLVETETAFLLGIVNQFVVIGRAGFPLGTEQDALAFLRQKCVNARFYRK